MTILLQGDIRVHVFNAGWYFNNDADSSQAGLDLVMLTHGWRRFNWTALRKGVFPILAYPADRGFLPFSGRAYNESDRKLLRKTSLDFMLRRSDSLQELISVPVDSAGRFVIDGLAFFDKAEVFLQVNKKGYAGKDVSIELDRLPQVPYRPIALLWGLLRHYKMIHRLQHWRSGRNCRVGNGLKWRSNCRRL